MTERTRIEVVPAARAAGHSGRRDARYPMTESARGAIVVNGGPFSEGLARGLRALLPAGERAVVCDRGTAVPADAQVLVMMLHDQDTIRDLLVPSIVWAHVLGAGVDNFPFDALGGRRLTCSRGAASVAIAEWVLAVMLAFEKSLPESWVSAPPEHWNIAALGTLAGKTVGLVGIGAIGTEVARRAQAFDAHVVAARRTGAGPPLSGHRDRARAPRALGAVRPRRRRRARHH